MKLSTISEAKLANADPKTQVFGKVFHAVREIEPNATINSIGHYCAAMMADHIHSDYSPIMVHEMVFEGLPALKDNPVAISEQLTYYYDAETGEDFQSLVENIAKFIKEGHL